MRGYLLYLAGGSGVIASDAEAVAALIDRSSQKVYRLPSITADHGTADQTAQRAERLR